MREQPWYCPSRCKARFPLGRRLLADAVRQPSASRSVSVSMLMNATSQSFPVMLSDGFWTAAFLAVNEFLLQVVLRRKRESIAPFFDFQEFQTGAHDIGS